MVVVKSLTYKPLLGKILWAKDILSIWNVGMGAGVSVDPYDLEEKINATVTLFQPT